jgi:hypothetical protein
MLLPLNRISTETQRTLLRCRLQLPLAPRRGGRSRRRVVRYLPSESRSEGWRHRYARVRRPLRTVRRLQRREVQHLPGHTSPQLRLSTLRHNQSTLQDLVEHAACWVCRLLAELSFEPGALLVPLAVAIRVALREARKTV